MFRPFAENETGTVPIVFGTMSACGRFIRYRGAFGASEVAFESDDHLDFTDRAAFKNLPVR